MKTLIRVFLLGVLSLVAFVGCNSTPQVVPAQQPQVQQGMNSITEEEFKNLQSQTLGTGQLSGNQTRNGGSCSSDISYGNTGQIAISRAGGSWYYWSVFMYQGSWSLSYQVTINGAFYRSGYGSSGYISVSTHQARVIIDVQGFGSLGYTRGSLICFVE